MNAIEAQYKTSPTKYISSIHEKGEEAWVEMQGHHKTKGFKEEVHRMINICHSRHIVRVGLGKA